MQFKPKICFDNIYIVSRFESEIVKNLLWQCDPTFPANCFDGDFVHTISH